MTAEKESPEEEATDISACWECATKHVLCARVEYFEYLQDNASLKDLMWCVGDLACAEKHLISIEPDLAEAVRQLRKSIMSKNIGLSDFDQVALIVGSMSGLFENR